nr:hypothetical protein Iba_chr02aCG16380 [Ipomoea batatas]
MVKNAYFLSPGPNEEISAGPDNPPTRGIQTNVLDFQSTQRDRMSNQRVLQLWSILKFLSRSGLRHQYELQALSLGNKCFPSCLPLKPDHSKQHRQTEGLVPMMSSSKNTRMGKTKKKEILPSSFQVKEDSKRFPGSIYDIKVDSSVT